MKLPIQARPIIRGTSSVRFSDTLISGVTASECKPECGWHVAACIPSLAFGPGTFAACLAATGIGIASCRDCIAGIKPNRFPSPTEKF